MVRVRFAPAPTGHLHFGGARTAFFNWLFARKEDGQLALRIEDTDQSRSTEQAISSLLESLEWLGIDWDDGPYRQTDRFELYSKYVDELLASGAAYRCYCSPEELAERRREAAAKRRTPRYNRRCLMLSKEEREKLSAERDAAIRFQAPDHGRTVVADLVRGRVSFENENLDDFILARSDGSPTYNLAAVVDDHDMKINHVIRGDDHLPNTPKQMLLFQALGWDSPRYGHLPLILGSDRAPLSKRHGAVAIDEYRADGFLPEALVNYLALLGWSYDDKTTILSLKELMARFSLEGVNKSAAVFDPAKLRWLNGHYIRQMSAAELAEKVLPFLKKAGLHLESGSRLEKKFPEMVAICQERISVLSDIVGFTEFFFREVEYDPRAVDKILTRDRAAEVLKSAQSRLETLDDFDTQNIEAELRGLSEELDLKAKEVFQPIRVAVTGSMVSPPLFESIDILGKDVALQRLQRTRSLADSLKP